MNSDPGAAARGQFSAAVDTTKGFARSKGSRRCRSRHGDGLVGRDQTVELFRIEFLMPRLDFVMCFIADGSARYAGLRPGADPVSKASVRKLASRRDFVGANTEVNASVTSTASHTTPGNATRISSQLDAWAATSVATPTASRVSVAGTASRLISGPFEGSRSVDMP